jgi:hypothetical protein
MYFFTSQAQNKKEQIAILSMELSKLNSQLDSSSMNYSATKISFENRIKNEKNELDQQQQKLLSLDKQLNTIKEEKSREYESLLRMENKTKQFKDTNFIKLYQSKGLFSPESFGGLISGNGSNFSGLIKDDYSNGQAWGINLEEREGGEWAFTELVLSDKAKEILSNIHLELDSNLNLYFWYFSNQEWSKIYTITSSQITEALSIFSQQKEELNSNSIVIVSDFQLPLIKTFFQEVFNEVYGYDEEQFEFKMDLEFNSGVFSVNISELMTYLNFN